MRGAVQEVLKMRLRNRRVSGERKSSVSPAPAGEDCKAAMPLLLASIGQELTLADIHAGRQLRHRLAEMGLTPGVRFRVVAKGQPGPFIISVKDTRLMLGRGMVPRIYVRSA